MDECFTILNTKITVLNAMIIFVISRQEITLSMLTQKAYFTTLMQLALTENRYNR